jgi:hypothetical protein
MHPIPGKVRRGYSGGTAACGGGVRVFKHFVWLEVGSVKMALSRPAHQPSPGRSAGVLTRRVPREEHTGRPQAVRWLVSGKENEVIQN